MNSNSRSARRIDLEAFRGIAALVVFVHHFLLAFSPETSGYLAEYRTSQSLIGSPFFGLINGKAAVYYFFVLSGYVLTVHFLRTGDFQALRSGFLKRLPRLYFPVLLSCLLAYALLSFGGMYCNEASLITGSSWLRNIGHGHQLTTFNPRFVSTLTESLAVFFNGVNHFNSVLWTMRPEMAGSLVVMLLAYFFRQLLQMKHLLYAGIIILLMAARLDPYLYPFILGFYIALIQAKYPNFSLNRPLSWALVCTGVYLCGFLSPIGAYAWMNGLGSSPDDVSAIGGTLVLLGVVFCERGYRYLSGSVGRFLGAQSFPIYLIHTLVIGSLSSWLFVTFAENFPMPRLLSGVFMATLVVILVSAFLFAKLDTWWVDLLSTRFRGSAAKVDISSTQ